MCCIVTNEMKGNYPPRKYGKQKSRWHCRSSSIGKFVSSVFHKISHTTRGLSQDEDSKYYGETELELNQMNLYIGALEKKLKEIQDVVKRKAAIKNADEPGSQTEVFFDFSSSNLKSRTDEVIQKIISGNAKKIDLLMCKPPSISEEESSFNVLSTYPRTFAVEYVPYVSAKQSFKLFPYCFHVIISSQTLKVFCSQPKPLNRSPQIQLASCQLIFRKNNSERSSSIDIEYSNEIWGKSGNLQLENFDMKDSTVQTELMGRIVCFLLGVTSQTNY